MCDPTHHEPYGSRLDATKYPILSLLEYSPQIVIHYHRALGFIA